MTPTALARTVLLTLFALTAFAANSVLCRLALGGHAIDAASFSSIRLLSGAAVLLALLSLRNGEDVPRTRGSWSAGFMLALYAIPFSYAYIELDTGTGALVLFGAVQITMILRSLVSGNRLHPSEWCGVLVAFSGLVYLNMPGATAPSLIGFLLMTVAGIAWGLYTLMGQKSVDPLTDTSFNFLRTLPFVILLAIVTLPDAHYSLEGCMLAVLSGGVASGVGYTVWYTVLKDLSTTQAAVIQLSVPPVATFGGILFVAESITLRLVLSTALILGGILLVILGRHYLTQRKPTAGPVT